MIITREGLRGMIGVQVGGDPGFLERSGFALLYIDMVANLAPQQDRCSRYWESHYKSSTGVIGNQGRD